MFDKKLVLNIHRIYGSMQALFYPHYKGHRNIEIYALRQPKSHGESGLQNKISCRFENVLKRLFRTSLSVAVAAILRI